MSKSKKRAEAPPPPNDSLAPRSKVPGIRALLDTFEGGIDDQMKISVTEYIRLVQLEQEMKSEEPVNIEVLWIDRLDDPSDGAD
jgi:hypothetical protein